VLGEIGTVDVSGPADLEFRRTRLHSSGQAGAFGQLEAELDQTRVRGQTCPTTVHADPEHLWRDAPPPGARRDVREPPRRSHVN
jgi:hypothetical protein